MADTHGNEGVNFFGKRGVNAADPINDKDVVNLRSLRRTFAIATASTLASICIRNIGIGYPVYAELAEDTGCYNFRSFSAGTNLNMTSGDTITFNLNDNIVLNGISAYTISASTMSAVNIDAQYYFSGGVPLNFTFQEKIWCASTGTQAVIRNNYTNNVAIGNFSIIGGAYSTSSGNFSVIAGGSGNTSTGNYGFLGGGLSNQQHLQHSTVVGGAYNIVSGQSAVVVGGFGNSVSRNFASILGGFGNKNNAVLGSIVGGNFNTAFTNYAVVVGGSTNYSVGNFALIGSGYRNSIYGTYGLIGNGLNNILKVGTQFSSILNGENNTIEEYTSHSSIVGGSGHTINSGLTNVVIAGGYDINALSSNTLYADNIVARSLSGVGVEYVFAEPDGHLIIGSGPVFSGITSIINTGNTHGIWVQTNNGVAVLKALSAGTNMNLFSSSTENSFALKDDIVVNSVYGLTVSGGTIFSGDTDVSTFFRYYWTAGTGLNALIRNNGTDNLASGAHSWVSGKANTATTAYSFVAQGWENKATGNHAFIGAGRSNSALTSTYATILNGKENTSSGARSTIINGLNNFATSTSSVVISGNYNSGKTGSFATVINGALNLSSGLYSLIGNGDNNTASNTYATVLNGILNTASNTHATVINGSGNTASGIRSTILNGQSNFATNSHSLVGSGTFNSAQTQNFATVISGTLGLASGLYSIVGTGKGNTASSTRSTVINGLYNHAISAHAFVGSGTYNSGKTGTFATVINGTLNLASGVYSFIGNGISNTASNGRATVLNGKKNQATSIYTVVINGSGNTASGNRSIVLGGISNLASSTYSLTLNGASNRATNGFSLVGNGRANSAHTSYSTVLNGLRNHISTGSLSNILNGTDNINTGSNSTILAGTDNVLNGSNAAILGGVRNSGLTTYSIIGTGIDNRVSNSWSIILGGSGNTIDSTFGFFTNPDSNIIGAGQNNYIGGVFARRSFIGTGIRNRVLTNNSGTILNGVDNYISNTNGGYSQILNGHGNIIYHGTYLTAPSHNTILGGHYNFIGNATTYTPAARISHCTILAGRYNTGFSNYGVVVTGIRNWARGTHSAIIAGSGNTTNATKTFIGNGQRNSITGTYSSILNGVDNYVTASQAFISNGTNLGLSNTATRSAIIGGRNYTGTTADMVYMPEATIWELTSSSVNTDFISTDVDGRLYRTDIASLGTLIGSTSSISGITNIGGTHGIWRQTVSNIAQLKSLSAGTNMNLFSSSTENSFALKPDIGITSLFVSGNTILSSTTANTITILSLSGGGTQMVVTDNNGLLGTQAIPGGTGSTISASNTGSTHGIFAGMSGSSVLVFKSLSAGTNMLISSSSTENSIALASDIVLTSVSATSISATTFYSGSTPLSTVINNSIFNNFRASAATSSQFVGNPKKATIAFVNVFSDDNYAISVIGDEERSWTFENKTSSGFVINSNSNIALTGNTHWIAQKYYI